MSIETKWVELTDQELQSRRRILDNISRPIVASAALYPDRHIIAWHAHKRSQLVYASQGVMTVMAEQGVWVVPPQRGVWVPGGERHRIRMSAQVRMCSLYVDPTAVSGLPTTCRVVTVSPLFRELVLHAVGLPTLYDTNGPDGRLMQLILDQLCQLPSEPLYLPAARSDRLRRITDVLISQPSDARTLADWAKVAGGSTRTLTRAFVRETGLTFTQWRQQARLMQALTLLARQVPVAVVAAEVGFKSNSAFITLFKKAMGKTPGRFFLND